MGSAGIQLLSLENVTTRFRFEHTTLTAVNRVSLRVDRGEIVGLVGESGCGKSMTAFSILGIVPHPGVVEEGRILFEGTDLRALSEAQMRRFRGARIALVYQDPLSSLNPSFTIFWHLHEVIRAHRPGVPRRERDALIINALKKVGIPDPEHKVRQYPHQFSGGMRQRVVIAMALVLNPSLIIADEPTTALDVTTQKGIFDLIESLREDLGLSFVIISHDLYLIGERCDRIYVMYSGQVVEGGKSDQIFSEPLHPYTRGLMQSIPSVNSGRERLPTIPGEVQNLMDLPRGCFFSSRCGAVEGRCLSEPQDLLPTHDGRVVRCWKARS